MWGLKPAKHPVGHKVPKLENRQQSQQLGEQINSHTKNRPLPWVRLKEASDLPEENLGQ